MFNQYFGNFLLEKKIITAKQLKEVLELQKLVRVKIGVLAIDNGFMNAKEVLEVHKLQSIKDKKFGEIAIEEGYLTKEKLEELLRKQKKSMVLLGQALINKGYITFQRYEEILIQFKDESGFSFEEFNAIRNNNLEKIVPMFVKIQEGSLSTILHKYIQLFVRNIARFIDVDVVLGKAEKIDSKAFDNLVYQKIDGAHRIFSALEGDKEVVTKFASIYAEEQCEEVDEIVQDSLGEFLNCTNGLFLSGLSNSGVELELSPPKFECSGKLIKTKEIYKIPCSLSFGDFNLLVSCEYPVIE